MFDVCHASAGTDVFIRNSMKNIIKRLTVEENHSTVFQGPGADKTELSGGAIKRVKLYFLKKNNPGSAGVYHLTRNSKAAVRPSAGQEG